MIGVIDKIEDDSYQGKDFKKVTLKDGTVLKVKYGKEGVLKAKWGELQEGRAYNWKMGDYQGKPFVQDFTAVGDELQPPQSVETHHNDVKPDPPKLSGQEVGMWWKHKAFSLSYSKDLACHGVIEIKDLYQCAEEMLTWLNIKG